MQTLLLDVALKPHAAWHLPIDPKATLFIYLVDGSCLPAGESSFVESHRAILFGEGDGIEVQAGPTGARFVLFAGRPLHEPIAWGGPIVMNTREELDQAFKEIRNKTFIRDGKPQQ